VAYRVEWEKVQQREKAKMDEIAEKERVAYAQVDWHDFVVVETVYYQPNEIGKLNIFLNSGFYPLSLLRDRRKLRVAK
jgi:hypothetical protein